MESGCTDASTSQKLRLASARVSTDAKLNLYLFLGKLSIGAKCGGLSARKYKNNCAQALNGIPSSRTAAGL
jgi:hypothetical protein